MEVFKMFGSVFLKDEKARKGLQDLDAHASKTSQGMGSKFGSVGGVFGKLGGSIGGVIAPMAAVAGAALGIGAAVAGVVKVGMDYTKQMSKVEALSNSNALQMAELGANARKLGAETRWSATNVAQAYEFMALAGWDNNQMIAASKPLLDLATAGALDLAKASDIVTDTMTPFNMKANEAARASDIFAVAQSSANLNVEQLGETMKYAAPQAATFGMDLEQTSAIAMIFANSGIKASMAGTALRAGLSRLAAPPKAAAKALDQMGVAIKHTDGTLRPMREIIADMAPKFNEMANAQQIAAAKAIFGEEAYAGWVQVLKGGVEQFDDFTEKLYTSEGAASVMANVMANNLSGAVDGVKSRTENLGLVIFSHLEPALVGATNGTNGLIQSFTNMLDPSGRAVEAAKLMQQSDQQLAQSKALLDMNLKKGKITQEEYNEKLEKSTLHAENMLNVDGMMAQKKEELRMKVEEGNMTQEEANKILDQSEIEYQKLQQGIEQTRKRQEAMNRVFEPLRHAIGIVQQVGEAIQQFWIAATGDRNALVEGYDILTKLGFSANSIQFVQDVTAAVQYGIETMKALVSGDWGTAGNFLTKLGFSPEQKASVMLFVQDIHAQISRFVENVKALISTGASVLMGLIGAAWEYIKGLLATIAPYVMPLLSDIMSFANGVISKITTFWKQNGEQIVQAVKNAFSTIQSIIGFVMPAVMWIIRDVWENIKGVINGALDIIMGTIKVFSSLLTGDWKGVWEGMKQILSGAWEFIWNFIQLWGVGKILGIIGKIGSKMKGLFKEAWEGVKQVFSDMFKGIFKSSEDTLKVIKDTFGKVKDAIANPFKDAWNGVKEWIDKIKNGVKNMFSGVKIPTPKITTSGSLNPMNWMSEGLPSFDIKWAAKGALVKPGMPTVIGVGDATGYDEAVLPLRDSTLGRIGQEIAQTMPQRVYQQQSDRPIELAVYLDKREIAREIYADIGALQKREEERYQAFKK
ncbi:phage tail tape measure protein [Bacillus cereus]|uniref:Phage tail tape measure protein, TP901 family, core region n=1 Tax=Bacillus cereus VD184 TaxID=1053242 RepID=A0A9W5RB68_BACCE|nr:phage tail tape measure protein [Bacillus cereus]EOQ18662.1 phage tail tape measure protein, TP901 family, core region [Bacillus cereus VD184]